MLLSSIFKALCNPTGMLEIQSYFKFSFLISSVSWLWLKVKQWETDERLILKFQLVSINEYYVDIDSLKSRAIEGMNLPSIRD